MNSLPLSVADDLVAQRPDLVPLFAVESRGQTYIGFRWSGGQPGVILWDRKGGQSIIAKDNLNEICRLLNEATADKGGTT